MMNRILIMGRLTKEPELRRTQNGTAVASLSIAVDRDFKSANGERETDFFNVIAWKSTAEFVCNYFQKGRAIAIDGRLQSRNWTDKDGGKRVSIEIVADSVYFADSKKENNESEYKEPEFTEAGDDGELPF